MYNIHRQCTTCDSCELEPLVVNYFLDIPVMYIYLVDLSEVNLKATIDGLNYNLTLDRENSAPHAKMATGILTSRSGDSFYCRLTSEYLFLSDTLYSQPTVSARNLVGTFSYRLDFTPSFTEHLTKENTRFCVNLGYTIDWYKWDGFHFVLIEDEEFFLPNVYYQWVNKLSDSHFILVDLINKDDAFLHQYMFDFFTGESVPKFVFNDDVDFAMLPEYDPNYHYLISVVNNLGLIARNTFQKLSNGTYKDTLL